MPVHVIAAHRGTLAWTCSPTHLRRAEAALGQLCFEPRILGDVLAAVTTSSPGRNLFWKLRRGVPVDRYGEGFVSPSQIGTSSPMRQPAGENG